MVATVGVVAVLAAGTVFVSSPVSSDTFPGANGQIAFSTHRDGNQEIYVMDADGTNPTNLTNNAATDLESSWSPDGTQIAFRSVRDGNPEIYVMDADGSNPTNLTGNAAADVEPNWQSIPIVPATTTTTTTTTSTTTTSTTVPTAAPAVATPAAPAFTG